MTKNSDVVVVGGCGHVGLPLAIALAGAGLRVISYDINDDVVKRVSAGEMPFEEPEAPERLASVLADGTFSATSDPSCLADTEHVVVVVGTPVDEHLNPDPEAVRRAVSELVHHLRDGQHVVLRSTVYPGVTRLVEHELLGAGLKVDLSFCPERIAEGKAFTELYELPQVVAGCTPEATARAGVLFGNLTDSIIEVAPEEAELVKLFTNTWRYIKFAAANQFYMIANDYDLDFERIRSAITTDYPRAADLPGPGFAAGPCLLKDTMQLAAFNNNNFTLGHASMMVNEGLPLYLVARMERNYDLKGMKVGVLGMAFKGESDDIRSSLAYKLRRILRFKAGEVLCTDPYVRPETDDRLVSLEQVLEESDILVIGAPHKVYRSLSPEQPVIDVWNLFGRGVAV
jgi:UDP-N-acetyl-D-mannosaminuronic acid dehydrogenase